MSYLMPGKLKVGYSLTRKRRNVVTTAKNSLDSGEFRPTKRRFFGSQLGPPFVEKSILVLTGGLGKQPYHGRVVLLGNEHTASAGEMVSALAEENYPREHRGKQNAGQAA